MKQNYVQNQIARLVYQVINKDGYMIHTNKELAQAVNETIKESGYKKTGSLIN